MKLVIVYLKTLANFLRSNKAASIVLFVSIALIFVSSMYFVNAFMSYKLMLSGYYRMRTIECSVNGRQNQSIFKEFPQKILTEGKGDVENILFRYETGEIRDSIETSLLAAYDEKEIEVYTPIDFSVVSYFDNTTNNERINAGQNINIKSVENSEHVIVYNKDIHMDLVMRDGHIITILGAYDIGDSISIMDHKYTIIGIINNFGYSMVPYSTGLKSLKLEGIDITFNENATDEQKRQLSKFIQNEYTGLDVSAPPKINQELFRKLFLGLLLLGIACFMGVFYLLYVYKYIIEANRKTIIINRILGLSMAKSVHMILFQIFIINTSAYIVTALLYRFVLINIFGLYIPDVIFYLIIYLFVVLMSSLIIFPFAQKICRKINAGEAGRV